MIKLLSKGNTNAKTAKNYKFGYNTYILHLAPHKLNSFGKNLCPGATKGCSKHCLYFSGKGGLTVVQKARIRRADFFIKNRNLFMNILFTELSWIDSKEKNVIVRLNGTSDIPYENIPINGYDNLMSAFPNMLFYDYTKLSNRFDKTLPSNYYLSFSRSENNWDTCLKLLNKGVCVNVVFYPHVPDHWEGFPVINGEINDLRFSDPKGSIIGLRYKHSTNQKMDIKNDFIIKL